MALESPLPDRIFETDDDVEDLTADGQVPTGLTADQLKEILASEREANEARMRQVLGGQAQRGVPLQVEETFPEINVDATGLPHPSVDIEGFLKGYGERTNKAMQEALKEVAGRVRRDAVQTAQVVSGNQGLVQRAFDLIREAAPEMEDDVIGFAAQKVADNYRAQGLDPMQALSTDLIGVAQEVLNYADMRFGGGGQEPAPKSRGGGNRTGGIRGGAGMRGNPRSQPRDEDPGDMVGELREFQTKNRIY